MNTNIVAIAVVLTSATNWTDVIVHDQELGYVVTNHVAQIEYAGRQTNVVLLTELSGIAVWRPAVTIWFHGPVYTNFTVTNYVNSEVKK